MTVAHVSGAALAAAHAMLAWFLTYFIHGAIAGGAAAALVRIMRPLPTAENRFWKIALFVPLASASLAAFLAARVSHGGTFPGTPVVLRTQAVPPPADVTHAHADAAVGLAIAIVLAIAIGAARFAVGLSRARRRLEDRSAPADPRIAASLAVVAGRFGLGPIHLTENAHLTTPVALAAGAICVPASLGSLAEVEIEAALAHELAHVERRDPLWFLLAGLVQAAFWMQPLNRGLAARLRRSAELACDDRAVAVTGDALALARALGRLAQAAYDAAHAVLPAAVHAPNTLVERVRRLTGSPSPSCARTSRSGAAAVLLASVAIGSAGVAVTVDAPSSEHMATARAATSPPSDVDVAAISRRVIDLGRAELRIEAQLDATRTSSDPSDSVSARIVGLEQDLRHAREERAWLERRAVESEAR